MLTEKNIKRLQSGDTLTIPSVYDSEIHNIIYSGGKIVITANEQGHCVFEYDGLELIFLGASAVLNGDITVQLYLAYLDDCNGSESNKRLISGNTVT